MPIASFPRFSFSLLLFASLFLSLSCSQTSDTQQPTESPSSQTTETSDVTRSAASDPTLTPISVSTSPPTLELTTPTPPPTSTATPAPTPTHTPEPTPTPHPNPNLRYSEEKQYALELVNDHRSGQGLLLLELGDNISAQIHAEHSLRDCHASLWSTDGLTPTAKYILAGGYQAFSTVISGGHYCGDRDEKESITRATITGKIERLLKGGDYFADQILAEFNNKHYRKLNVGLVRDSHYTTAVFLLERDYIEYEELPVLEEGV